ncbi:Methylated-DNA--protein-cysteine methyltransferase-like [Homarus americanus]|uniref:Methylated-DNA--protein-cysteine methyltransferase n=1 Tax=Homarus americanus TaxID=6706 RepID=A0A8J5JX27_HOMAM|nr:Methylated-DNA--protein-cysteine methyltransferase-like [Homarus americanus]
MSSNSTVKKERGSCGSSGVKYRFSSPLGYIIITACAKGLHAVELAGNISDENFSPNERTEVQLLQEDDTSNLPKVIQESLTWFQVFFKDPELVATVPRPEICCFKQSRFHARVWQTLADTVGPGEVITYGALAARLKNPGAARAVGSAMRNNPNSIIVPCHRVVRSNGMGLYHGGQRQNVKLWLLKHEGVDKFK